MPKKEKRRKPKPEEIKSIEDLLVEMEKKREENRQIEEYWEWVAEQAN